MSNGWRKQWRKVWENPVIAGNPNTYTVWGWLLDHVVWEDTHVRFASKTIILKPGQITCGSFQIARDTGVRASTVRRILKCFRSEQLIDQRTDMQTSLITVINWELYQSYEQRNEQRMISERATSEQRVSTNKEEKNIRTKETYVVRPETESLYETLEQQCNKYGLVFEVNRKPLDALVERYVGKLHMKVEAQHAIAWLLNSNEEQKKKYPLRKPRSFSTLFLGNWFKKAQEIQKRDQLKQLEWKEAQINPAAAQRHKQLKGKAEGFDLEQSVHDFAASQS